MSYRTLVGEPDVCRGGHLKSIVFCCTRRKCPFFQHALKELEISFQDYKKVKKKHKKVVEVEGKKIDLAWARSLETKEETTIEAIKKLGWSPIDYYAYKYEILRDLLPLVRKERLESKIVKPFTATVVDLEGNRSYNVSALGSLEMGFLSIKEIAENSHDKVIDEGGTMEYVGVRVPKTMLSQIDEIINRGMIASRSDAIRLGLVTVIRAYKSILEEQATKQTKSL